MILSQEGDIIGKKGVIMKFILLIALIVSFINASSIGIDKEAYSSYKRGEYKKAFELYKKSLSLKADYNLAQFYEQGIGTEKNLKKAQEYYWLVYNNIDIYSYKTCEDEMLPYYYITFKKLKKYDDSKKLKSLCNQYKNPYIRKCPAANVVPRYYRKGIETFSCFYYKKFPNSMKRLLKIHSKIKSYSDLETANLVAKNRAKIVRAIKPIVNYYIKKESRCINRAKYNKDIRRCLDEYENFLHKAFLSEEVSVMRAIDKETIAKERAAYQEERAFLNKAATKKDKQEALRDLKSMHKNVKSAYFR